MDFEFSPETKKQFCEWMIPFTILFQNSTAVMRLRSGLVKPEDRDHFINGIKCVQDTLCKFTSIDYLPVGCEIETLKDNTCTDQEIDEFLMRSTIRMYSALKSKVRLSELEDTEKQNLFMMVERIMDSIDDELGKRSRPEILYGGQD